MDAVRMGNWHGMVYANGKRLGEVPVEVGRQLKQVVCDH